MAIDYRARKKFLNKFHKFAFKMPPKNKDFTPQQKAAITRVLNKIEKAVKAVAAEKNGFLPLTPTEIKKLGKNFDYRVKTNKGIFTKFPFPEKKKQENQIIISTRIGVRKEIFFPFPENVKTLKQIDKYVKALDKKYGPEYIKWSVNGYMGGGAFMGIEVFSLYTQEFAQNMNNKEKKKFRDEPYFNGVFLGWEKG